MKDFILTSYNALLKTYGKYYIFVLLIVPLVLTSVWFKGTGTLMAAEEGPLFYNLSHTYSLYSHIWTDSGLGLANPLITPRIPFYFVFSQLSSLGLSASFLQQLLFFILLIVPLLSMPLLVRLFFPEHIEAGKISAIFYLLNLYTQSQILHRFLYPQIYLWSYLPLFLYLFTRWITSRHSKYLFFLLFTSFLYSLMFSFLSTAMVIWTCAGIISIAFMIKDKEKALPYISLSFFALVLWLLTNIWWIIPIVSTQNNNYSSALDSNKNLSAVVEVSKYFTNKTIFHLKQSYYFAENPSWGIYLYNDIIPWIILSLAMLGIYVNRRKTNIKIFIVLLFVGWFISKGANPPYGKETFDFLFSEFPLTQILRNPYEKFGVAFLLPYSVFLGLGLNVISRNKIVTIIALLFICGGAVKPMWDGSVFAGYNVSVPESYSQINKRISKDGTFRLLSMPFLHTANVRYSWGYKGEELSELFFVRPILSRTYNAPDDIYPLLYKHIRDSNFTNLFPFLSINGVLLHKDVTSKSGYQEGYGDSSWIISSWNDMQLIEEKSELILYKYDKKVDWGYAASRVVHRGTTEGIRGIVDGKIKFPNDAFTDDKLINLEETDVPNIVIRKISADTYQAQIKDASNAYVLVLSTSYNQNWRAKINSENINTHFKVNGFANGWVIDKKGDYTIDIKFKVYPWD